MNASLTACKQAWKLYQQTGQFSDRPRSGRPRKTDERLNRRIKRTSENDRKKTATDISKEIAVSDGIQLSRYTISRRLRQFGLYGRISKKKPFVSLQNRRRRLAFARAHVDWTPKQWSQVLFSDEKKFNRIGSDGRIYVRRRIGEVYAPQCLRPTVKGGGGSVMTWGCFSASGPGPIHRIVGKMDAQMYEGIMENVMMPYADDNLPLNWTFQQDNDPKHTAGRLQRWFATNHIRLLDWPSQSPDLNPIENLWADVQKCVQARKARNLNELLQIIQESWAALAPDRCKQLVNSMSNRCREVIKSFGYPTRY